MNIMDILAKTGGGQALLEKASGLGLDADSTGSALGAMLPALARGVQSKADASGMDLGAMLSQLGGGQAEAMVDAASSADLDEGIGGNILGQLLGGADAQQGLASRVAEKAGVDAGAVEGLMPSVTGLLAGVMSKAENGSLDVGELMGGGMMGSMMNMAAGFLGGGGGSEGGASMIMNLLDKDGDGSIIDDLLGM